LKIKLNIKTNPFVVLVFLQFEIQKIKQLLRMLMVRVIATTPVCTTWTKMQTLNQNVAAFPPETCGRNQMHYVGALKRIVEGGFQCFFRPT